MDDLLSVGLSMLQGGAAGGDSPAGALQVLLGALGGSGGGTRAYGSAREASGGLLLQSVVQTLLGGR